jgi:hypothetical protein
VDTLSLARGNKVSLEVSATGISSYVKFGLTGVPAGVAVSFVAIDATDAYLPGSMRFALGTYGQLQRGINRDR